MEGALRLRIEELTTMIEHETTVKEYWDRKLADGSATFAYDRLQSERSQIKLSAFRMYRLELQRQLIDECRDV